MMRQTWRWFGPNDKVTLQDIRQAGAEGIVTALHQFPPGALWDEVSIKQRINDITSAGSNLTWDVVESLPVSEDIRTAGPNRDAHIATWIESMTNLAKADVKMICYNFMPVLDWTRTNLAAPMPSGASALLFDLVDFTAFDMHVLKRDNASHDYPADIVARANAAAGKFTEDDIQRLTGNILAGLPGAMESWTIDSLRQRLSVYGDIDAEQLRQNLLFFLEPVVPHAEKLGMRLCCHPDDPPWPLFGLPRIMSTEADYRWLVDAVPSRANGITFCTGSLGARGDNDLPGMVERLGEHIHFFHLRNVRRHFESVPCSFHEDDHLSGCTDMVAVIKAVLKEQNKRKQDGRSDWQIPMRPDHGQEILDDKNRKAAPGYPAIGRLKGLAELRGVMMALEHGNMLR